MINLQGLEKDSYLSLYRRIYMIQVIKHLLERPKLKQENYSGSNTTDTWGKNLFK